MKKQIILTLVLATFSYVFGAAQTAAPQLGKDPVSAVVKAMTLDEKIDLVVGQGMFLPGLPMPGANAKPTPAQQRVLGAAGTTVAIPRLGIPALVVCDGPAGIHPFNTGKSRMYYATAWPTGTLLASSWDTALIKNMGASFGNEAKEYGIDILLGPGMNIHRNPLGGRNFEYYSEDPVITGNIAAAMVSGIQSAGVGTSVKHFAVNNQEIVEKALEQLRHHLLYKPVGYNLLPKQFTLRQLQSIYELILNKKLDRPNFNRKMLSLDILIKREKLFSGTAHKAPYLYSFHKANYFKFLSQGFTNWF